MAGKQKYYIIREKYRTIILETITLRFPDGHIAGLASAIKTDTGVKLSSSTLRRVIQGGKRGEEKSIEAICAYFEFDMSKAAELAPKKPSSEKEKAGSRKSQSYLTQKMDNIRQKIDVSSIVESACEKIKFSFEVSNQRHQHDFETDANWLKDNYIDLKLFEVQSLPSEYLVPDEKFLLSNSESRDNDTFDRLGIRPPDHRLTTGTKVIQTYPKILLYGEPGSGKTSYLRWLALGCRNNILMKEYVPLFFEGSKFSTEEHGASTLSEYFENLFEEHDIAWSDMEHVLGNGKGLFIIDGFDEVSPSNQQRFLTSVLGLLSNFDTCSFIISSRLAFKVPLSEGFQKVLVAPFDKAKHIPEFIHAWFNQPGKNPEKAKMMIAKLNYGKNGAIREITQKPILLQLLCYLFENNQEDDFPSKRVEAFQSGINFMIRSKDHDRPNIPISPNNSRKLTTNDVRNILCEIAYRFFLEGKNVFSMQEAERVVKDYCEQFYEIDRRRVDGSFVISKIEQYNGLIVHKAREYCSFSHLTYQEYFVAQHLVETRQEESVFRNLVNPRWKFVIELTSELIESTRVSKFFETFKQEIDSHFYKNETLRSFVSFLDSRTEETIDSHREVEELPYFLVRAWYFVHALVKNQGHISTGKPHPNDFRLPDRIWATSTIDAQILKIHSRIYDIYRYLHRPEPPNLEYHLQQLIKILPEEEERTIEILKGWIQALLEELNRRDNDILQWWEDDRIKDRWMIRMQFFMENQRIPFFRNTNDGSVEQLEKYYESTFLFSNCLMCSRLSIRERKEFASDMLSFSSK